MSRPTPALADTITINNHRFLTGSRVTYLNGGGGNIGGLSTGTVYFTIKVDHNTIQLAANASDANAGTKINITGTGTGLAHTLSVAFDVTPYLLLIKKFCLSQL